MTHFNKSLSFIIAFMLVCMTAFGQKNIFEGDYNAFLKEVKETEEIKEARVAQFLQDKRVERWQYLADGTVMYLDDIDANGNPVYLVTDNRGAGQTTGASAFRSNANSGLNLDGSGVRIGIWDGGIVRDSHHEFNGRVQPLDGNELNDHATHVAGTILSKGVDDRAIGMAPGARAFSYDFSNAASEILAELDPAREILLLSNHSYGIPAGMFNGVWRGPEGVTQDPVFGHYSGLARQMDDFSYNAPFHLYVKSAGNQRNENPGYDIITHVGLSKNILTIGAVQKINNGYTKPSDVVMSSFSSWGPADDGRIKPDIVAPGVSMLSPVSGADDSYGSLSGTSMAAPSATGSMALMQQMHAQLTRGQFMRAATLKALVIHTAYQTGDGPGPDYAFGWGLINVPGAVDFLLKENGENFYRNEGVLNDGATFKLDFTATANQPVKATIVWTDLPGTSVPLSLNDRTPMLVNDLDLRIYNGEEAQMPWRLNPENPAAPATKGDNLVDNVEQVYFTPDQTTNYQLVVSHKGSLQTGQQRFSLILSYDSPDNPETFFWLGQNDDWNDQNNWSFKTKGETAGKLPSAKSTVVFDENATMTNIRLNANAQFKSLKRLSKSDVNLDLNGFDLIISGGFTNAFSGLSVSGEGNIKFVGESGVTNIVAPGHALAEVNTLFEGVDAQWVISGDASFKGIDLLSGSITASGNQITVGSFNVDADNGSTVSLNQVKLRIKNLLNFSGNPDAYNIAGGEFTIVNDARIADLSPVISKLVVNAPLILASTGQVDLLENNSVISLEQNLTASNLTATPGAVFNFAAGISLIIETQFNSTGTVEKPIKFLGATENGKVVLDGRYLVCLDYLEISNVDFSGGASVTAGVHSTLTNAAGWFDVACDDVLFPDFTVEYTCAGGVPFFTNTSNGVVEETAWIFSNGQNSDQQVPYVSFDEPGSYQVTLSVTNDGIEKSFTKSIEIVENTLQENVVLESGDNLVSTRPSSIYQWFKDYQLLEGETNRVFNPMNEAGIYFVLTFDETCNRKTPDFELIVLGLDGSAAGINLYPNPVEGELNIAIENELAGPIEIKLFTIDGRLLAQHHYQKQGKIFNEKLNFSHLNGTILVKISMLKEVYTYKIITNK